MQENDKIKISKDSFIARPSLRIMKEFKTAVLSESSRFKTGKKRFEQVWTSGLNRQEVSTFPLEVQLSYKRLTTLANDQVTVLHLIVILGESAKSSDKPEKLTSNMGKEWTNCSNSTYWSLILMMCKMQMWPICSTSASRIRYCRKRIRNRGK